MVLQKGLNFAPAPSSVPIPRIIASVERGLAKLPDDQAEQARKLVAGVLARARPPPSNLPPEVLKALRSLRDLDDVFFLPADKGMATVVIDREQYDAKIMELLSDERTYRLMKKDPCIALERKLNSLLLQLKKKGSLPADLYNRLRSSGSHTLLLYGLPKVHKLNVPLRPIDFFVQSPTYRLSQYLSRLLSPLVGSTSSFVRNSSDFVAFISAQTLRPDDLLVSFDVVSLFTNVPVPLAVEVARRRLRADTSLPLRTSLSVNELADLLEFCLSATYLSFRGRTYQQTFGTAMGSPVSVTVANLVMEDVEERALSTSGLTLPFWKRYVDDVCTAVPGSRMDELLRHLNSTEPSIQFTHEVEVDGRLPFLDVQLHRQPDGSVSMSVFRKPSHTDKYMNFHSHHPPPRSQL